MFNLKDVLTVYNQAKAIKRTAPYGAFFKGCVIDKVNLAFCETVGDLMVQTSGLGPNVGGYNPKHAKMIYCITHVKKGSTEALIYLTKLYAMTQAWDSVNACLAQLKIDAPHKVAAIAKECFEKAPHQNPYLNHGSESAAA